MTFTVTIKKEEENSNTINKDYVDRNFIINHINAMIEHHENQDHLNDRFYRGYIAGLQTVKNQLENLYNPPVF